MIDIYSSKFETEYDDEKDLLKIIHPDKIEFLRPLVEIRRPTLEGMTFKQASQFIGED